MEKPTTALDTQSLMLARKLKKFLKFHHPENIRIPGRVAQHANADPFKAPKYPHKDGKWTWERADQEDWSSCTMFGILLRTMVVIHVIGAAKWL